MRTHKQINEDLQQQLDDSPPSTRVEENLFEEVEFSFEETSSRDRMVEGSVVSGASSDSGGGGMEGDDDAAGGEEQLVEQSSSPAASASVAAASNLSSSSTSPPRSRRTRSASVAGLPAPSVRLKAPRLPSAGKSFSAAEIKSLLSLVGEHGRRWRHIAEKMEELGYQKRSADALRNKFDDLAPQAKREKVKGQTKTTYALSTSNGDKTLDWTLPLDALLLHLTRTCKRKVTRQRAGDVVDWPEVAKQIPGRSVSMLRARRAELVKMDEGRREKVSRLLKRLEEEDVVKEEEECGGEIMDEEAEEDEEEENEATESTPAMDALVEAALASPLSRRSPAPPPPNEPTFSYPSASTPSTFSPDIVYVSLPRPPSPDQPRVTLTFQGQALRTTNFQPFNRLPPPSSVPPTAAPVTAGPSATQQPFPYFLPRPSYGLGPSASASSSAPVTSTSTSKPPPKVYHLPSSSRTEERTPRFLPPASFPVFPTSFPPSSLAYGLPSYGAKSAPSTECTGNMTGRTEGSGIERAPGGACR